MDKTGKIGILTFHCTNNYGAVLQAYALKQFIQALCPGREVRVIDYRCEGTISKADFESLRKKNGLVKAAFSYPQAHVKNERFETFRREMLNLTKPYFEKTSLKVDMDGFDAVISGSDQVWNRRWSDGDDVYFQDYHDQNNKKWSYAASFGFATLEGREQIELYRQYLQQFSHISVREDTGLQIVRDQLGLPVEQHVDPTLLLTQDMWNDIADESRCGGRYILLYMVPKQDDLIAYAIRLGKKTGLPVVMLSQSIRLLGVRHAGNSSPQEFVGYFKNAEHIVTNSFHGTAFSVIYHKNLHLNLQTPRGFNVRSKSLLGVCGLPCQGQGNMVHLEDVDWDAADRCLDAERNRAEAYLRPLATGAPREE